MIRNIRLATVSILIAGIGLNAPAYINPNFTPVDLIDQSDIILTLTFSGIDEEGMASADVQEALKGEFPSKQLRVDLYAGAFEAQGDSVRNQIEAGQKSAMLFVGFFQAEGMGEMDPQDALGFLHIGNRWIILYMAEETLWDMDKEEARLLGTWSGGTEMLLRAVKGALADSDLDFPINAGRTWDEPINLGTIKGNVASAASADVDGDGKAELFLACDEGDRLYRWDGAALKEITSEAKLSSKSLAYAWGDFNGDGLTDLASWDGSKLSVLAQDAGGGFKALCSLDSGALADKGCTGITTVDSGKGGTPVLLAVAGDTPVLISLKTDLSFEEKPLAGAAPQADKDDGTQDLFCADLDGDARPDVIQLFRTHSLFYKGIGPTEFKEPVKTRPGTGMGENGACLGDYDADGLPDICTVAQDRNRIWQNLGNMEFVDSVDRSGEIYYIAKPGGTGVWTGDLSNDGRQDIFIIYAKSQFPKIFFNRGFRSFGHARMLDLANLKILEQTGEGQRAGCLGDFNHDGALDMCLVLPDGNVWLFTRKMETEPDLALFVGLSKNSPCAGPLNVTATQFDRPFGAHVVRAGETPACFGMREPGPVTLTWQFPGQEVQTREVIVEDEPVYLFLE